MLMKKVEQIELNENDVYVVKDGQIYVLVKPATGFGQHQIVWQNGKPHRIVLSTSERF